MNRSTLRSLKLGLATAVFCCSALPLAGVPSAAADGSGPNTGARLDIVYGDGDEGPIAVGTIDATPRPTVVTLRPGDVVFGDGDEGPIDAGPPLTFGAPPPTGSVNARVNQDVAPAADSSSGDL